MGSILMVQGIPASGKSTYAKGLAKKKGYVRVNKDDLRDMLYAGKWKPQKEKLVLKARDHIISTVLSSGGSVVVDDTNFHPKHEERLKQLAKEHKANFTKKLIDVPLVEALERNRRRQDKDPVPDSVIRDMWVENIRGPIEYDTDLTMAIIVDLDGTLAHNVTGRSPYDWHRVGEDEVDQQVRSVVNAFSSYTHVIVLSGRDGVCRPETEAWLKENRITYHDLFMREPDDKRKDSIVKRELFEGYVKGVWYPWLVIDDRDQVVSMWRDELGLKVWQVAWGNF